MNTEQIILSVIGAGITMIVASLAFMLKTWINDANAERKKMGESIVEIVRKFGEIEKAHGRQYAQLDKSLSEINLNLGYRIDLAIKDMGKIEGRLDEHMRIIADFISAMRSTNDKLDAVFRYVDADPRSTDVRREAIR